MFSHLSRVYHTYYKGIRYRGIILWPSPVKGIILLHTDQAQNVLLSPFRGLHGL